MREVRVQTAAGKFGQKITIGPHAIAADEEREAGGDDTGPGPTKSCWPPSARARR